MQRAGAILLFLWIGFGIWACSECDPTPNPPRSVAVVFYDQDSLTVKDTTFLMVFSSITDDIQFTSDTVNVLSSLDSATQTLLPIDFRAETITFVFLQALPEDTTTIDTAIVEDILNLATQRRLDTLRLRYKTQLVILGPDCGYYEAVDSLTIDKSTFDSTVIINPTLTTDSVNVEIYL